MKIIRGCDIGEDFFTHREWEGMPLVKEILSNVKKRGDDALRFYTRKFDGAALGKLRVGVSEIREARRYLDADIMSSMRKAMKNLKKFSELQFRQIKDCRIQTERGVFCGQKVTPVQRIGIYVPAGRFPLFSTLLMCAIPARVAGVEEVVVFSPPSFKKKVHPLILAASDLAGIEEVYRVGGAQAIAAMAYGTQTIRKVDKIVGPGNKYVTMAKKEVFGEVGIDFVAGPTEILIVADDSADPRIIAADLLAQAEHDTEAQMILITDSASLAENVCEEIRVQIKGLATRLIAEESVEKNGIIVLVRNMEEAQEIANRKAPEHIELQVTDARSLTCKFKNYGSLFIGPYSAEVLGDYSSGLNHTLPTNGAARYTGGLSVRDFVKFSTTLEVTRGGLSRIGRVAMALAEKEGLKAHAQSVNVRMESGKKRGK